MIIDNILLDRLTTQAKESPRLRMNLDLRNSDGGFVTEDVECVGARDSDSDSSPLLDI